MGTVRKRKSCCCDGTHDIEKKVPAKPGNRKAELELEQYRHVLELDRGRKDVIEKDVYP